MNAKPAAVPGPPRSLANRTTLRGRVFLFTLLYAAMLVGVVFFITSSAIDSQRELSEQIKRELDTTNALVRLMGVQAAFRQNLERSDDAGFQLSALAEKRVLGDFERIRAVLNRHDQLELAARLQRFESELQRYATRWDSMGARQRRAAVADLAGRSEKLSNEANQIAQQMQRSMAARLGSLEDDAKDTVRSMLGIAYLIAVVSLLIAKTALERIVRPLEELSRAARRLKSGEPGARAPVGGDLEIALLAHEFNRMAASVESAQQQLAQTARTDDLTRLPNFRAFQERIEQEIERSNRYAHTFGVLVLDIDHFKKYNDRYGHLAGNEALQAVAVKIRRTLRTVDFPARYGGEEFAAILPEIDGPGLSKIAERVRAQIQSIPPFENRDPITASIGGALFPEDGMSAQELFAAADRRLYEAKESGRNRAITPAPQTLPR